jgi:ABC-type lipoprotein release transport system permease subunit
MVSGSDSSHCKRRAERRVSRSQGHVLTAMLNDVKPTDPGVFALTGIAMLAVVLAASALPARAAGRVDPIVVLEDS